MLWDESADDLILAGAARVVVPASGLVIASTAVSSTAAELNLLDGLDRGSIIYGNASSATTVLGQGSADQVLTSDGTDISWADASGGASDLDGLSDCKSGGTNFSNSMILGHQTTGTLSTASYNTAVGYAAMDELTSGDENTLMGYSAGHSITTGNQNCAFGSVALGENISSSANSAFGENALMNNTAANNSAFGAFALDANTTGTNNSAFGKNALSTNVDGAGNTAVGKDVLVASTGASNTAVGYNALTANTSGAQNTAVGTNAGKSITDGTYSTYLGYGAGGTNTGTQNVYLGGNAGGAGSGANGQNVVIGADAGYSGNGADDNVFVGWHAGLGILTGDDNTAIGSQAGDELTSGDNNCFVGLQAGTADSPSGAITTGSNEICLGNSSITEAHIKVDWTVSSDGRDKAEQTNFTGGLDWINAMQPITYYWDQRASYCSVTDPTLKITTSIADTFTVNETVKGQTSNAYGIFKSGSGDTLTFESAAGTFVAGETVVGDTSGIEAIIAASDFFDNGQITPAEILAITPDGTHKESSLTVGFVAQDILVIEQANGYGSDNDDSLIVDLTEDETRYAMKATKIIPMLVNAVKELSAKNDALEARIVALEG
jgi:hypothetical protein